MTQQYTCIVCPKGCEIRVEVQDKEILSISGNGCKNGITYVTQEVTAPMRTVSSSVYVSGGELPLASVRTNRPIPKHLVLEAVAEIRKITLTAPVKAGTVVIQNLLGTGSNVITTKNVEI